MLDDLVTVQRAAHVVVWPPLTKFGTDLPQILNQLLEPGIARIASAGRPKLCERRPRNHFPVGTRPRGRASEESPDHVTCVWGRCIRKHVRNVEESIGSLVPCQIVMTSSQDISGTRVQVIQQLLERRTDV